MVVKLESRIVSYEEAQELLPAFEHVLRGTLKGQHPKKWLKDIMAIVQELRLVRSDIEYSIGGKQIYLSPNQTALLDNALEEVR